MLCDFSVVLLASPQTTSFSHYMSCLPDVDTWHKCLGQCSHCTVIDMACSQFIQGMHVNLSLPPPKCEHCILSKQTCLSVLKTREGSKAEKPLNCVYVDLCGPMSTPSCNGNLYFMNIINDFSGFVWSIPLQSKDQATPALKAWLFTLEVQTPHCLISFVTDNGELASSQIIQWCTQKSILHLFIMPYTLAHNGHAEWLHHTLMNKAHTMMSACHTPLNMWDEFCSTVVKPVAGLRNRV